MVEPLLENGAADIVDQKRNLLRSTGRSVLLPTVRIGESVSINSRESVLVSGVESYSLTLHVAQGPFF